MKTKTFTILANQRALLVSRNAEKSLTNNKENSNVRNLISVIFPKICFFFHRNFCLRNDTGFGNESNYR